MTNPIIKPTVGRVVWFHPFSSSAEANFARHQDDQPYAAIIARVWSDQLVNLTVLDANGTPHSRTSVYLVQEGEGIPVGGFYCEWMPYQKGQAAKIEAAEKELAQEPKAFNPSQREQLEYALVSGASVPLAHSPHSADSIATGIQTVLDRLYPQPLLTNPHTGAPRDPRDVASDPQAIVYANRVREILGAAFSTIPSAAFGADPEKFGVVAIDALPVVDPGPDRLERAHAENHASAVLYPAIKAAMAELSKLHDGFNMGVNRAFNILHDAFWSEVPAPAGAAGKRAEAPTAEQGA